MLFLEKGLEERVAAEGENSPADVIMTVSTTATAHRSSSQGHDTADLVDA